MAITKKGTIAKAKKAVLAIIKPAAMAKIIPIKANIKFSVRQLANLPFIFLSITDYPLTGNRSYGKIIILGGGRMSCPKADKLIDLSFFPEKLGKEATAEIRKHIQNCLKCKATVLRYEKEKAHTKTTK